MQDWLVVSYLTVLNLAVLHAVRGPSLPRELRNSGLLLLTAVLGVYLARFSPLKTRRTVAWLYRICILGPVQLSYFMFRELLPAINPGSLDQQLLELDLAWFGVEPAVELDRFVNGFTTEWFAFFYFSYFFVLATHVIPLLFAAKSQRLLGEFTTGVLGVVCVGHVIYMLVPGVGPYHAMAGSFTNPFPRGLWLDLVMEAVNSGGAQKDIFPSLHTALPCFITLFSFRHRDKPPFRYTWPVVAFFALNIVVATMFLRGHYLIVVVAGLLLASLCGILAPRWVDRELLRRRRGRLTDLWPPA